MSSARYAVYYVPPKNSTLSEFGKTWLGIDIETGELQAAARIDGLSQSKLEQLIESPRAYGFHGTLKPPFSLAANSSLDGLLSAIELYATGLTPFEIPPLELAFIGKFLALSPESSSAPLENMAAGCVRALEGFRAHRTEKELARYRQSKLTVHQEQMLDNWGYPYVLEEFRFHMTLSDRIDDEEERYAMMEAAIDRCSDIVGQPLPVEEIAVCSQPADGQPMQIVKRIPFGRA
jgi:putative phosphonate metabolism protein